MQQIVLQILEQNVSRGSDVYETNHILVLAWADTQRDREVVWKILSQVCHPPSGCQQSRLLPDRMDAHCWQFSWSMKRKQGGYITKCGVCMQLCLAYRTDGGRIIVVLSKVPKTEMEATFKVIIPEAQRYGTTFVFRQGNPLLPDDLRMVCN